MLPDFIDGFSFGIILTVFLIFFLNWLDQKLMTGGHKLPTELTIALPFRVFAFFAIIVCGVGGSILFSTHGDYAGSEKYLVIGLSTFMMVTAVYFLCVVFLIKAELDGSEISIKTLFGKSTVNLENLKHAKCRTDLMVFDLADDKNRVRFCNYIECRRALIEHIIQSAPSDTTGDLTKFLAKY